MSLLIIAIVATVGGAIGAALTLIAIGLWLVRKIE